MGILSFSALLNLFFPINCAGCGSLLKEQEDTLCLKCLIELPETKHENQLHGLFKGKVKIENTLSLYEFHKASLIQSMLHELKYNKQERVGVFLGKLLEKELSKTSWISDIDLIIPVPIHKTKKRQRGYNQTEIIANGMDRLNIQVDKKNLFRAVATNSQTKKSRFARWKNVSNTFAVKSPLDFEGKHLLIIDDVVTTGSTLIACAEAIQQVSNTKISIATLAYA